MGHMIDRIGSMFCDVNYNTKTTSELRAAMTAKVAGLREHIKEREQRIQRIRDEYNLDSERLAMLVMRFKESKGFVSYENQGSGEGEALVPAGVIANLVRERQMIDSEVEQIRKLELILRNIRDEELYEVPRTGEIKTRPSIHELSDEDLEYLGF